MRRTIGFSALVLVACGGSPKGGAATSASASVAPAAGSIAGRGEPSAAASAPRGAPSGGSATNAGAANDWLPVKGADYEGVIAPRRAYVDFGVSRAAGAAVEDGFVPEAGDVQKAEASLAAALAKVHAARAIPPKLASYWRQYVGIVAGGKRKLYVNAFCHAFGDWQRNPVVVDDGGDCYFQAVFDLDAGTWSHIGVNGEA